MPFLEEDEWSRVAHYLGDAVRDIKEYREEHGCDLTTARLNVKPQAMKLFEEITGMAGVHFEIIMHHRLKDWGQECPVCHHLLRTPKAKYCIKCGWEPSANA